MSLGGEQFDGREPNRPAPRGSRAAGSGPSTATTGLPTGSGIPRKVQASTLGTRRGERPKTAAIRSIRAAFESRHGNLRVATTCFVDRGRQHGTSPVYLGRFVFSVQGLVMSGWWPTSQRRRQVGRIESAADNRQLTTDELPLNLFPIDRDFRRGDDAQLDAATVGVQHHHLDAAADDDAFSGLRLRTNMFHPPLIWFKERDIQIGGHSTPRRKIPGQDRF